MVDPTKIEVVHDWARPTSVTEVRSFVRLASYYNWFVEGFSTIASSLTQLTCLYVPFEWPEVCDLSSQNLKELLTATLILTLPVEGEGFMVYCKASGVGFGLCIHAEGMGCCLCIEAT
ncbi:hypothetical protein MTR67_048381 [Solanum verrucosum]|uniref:Uncharacterized protein n=1 Tax=Solanum verrucosum TaxID=315347 RepID=A0AAF0V171_SOLVR|nr:hypothetical protein MTR67_048381 [Solanum verrucosum]